MSYNMIQFIDRRTNVLHNYIPDYNPYSYGDCVDMKAVFKIYPKYKTYRFMIFGFEIKITKKI